MLNCFTYLKTSNQLKLSINQKKGNNYMASESHEVLRHFILIVI
jgi:hypothetical protein